MEPTIVRDFAGVPYIAVDKSVTKVVIVREDANWTFEIPATLHTEE